MKQIRQLCTYHGSMLWLAMLVTAIASESPARGAFHVGSRAAAVSQQSSVGQGIFRCPPWICRPGQPQHCGGPNNPCPK
jgi:hypothetical protein